MKRIEMRVKVKDCLDCRVGGLGYDEGWILVEDGIVRLVVRVGKIGWC